MTRVEFFFNVPDKLAKVAELCDRAVAKRRQLTIFTQDDVMSANVQALLWQHSATSFLPSAYPGSPEQDDVAIIVDKEGTQLLQDDILINLKAEHPPFFSRFKYLVELVGADDADKALARARYKFYRDRGYQIKSTDESAS
ncbi:DNA polymerase III subunit chi [Methylotenera mobilis]|uniref:DNA polymerase III chi subunit HolC n=1 Tax=Methylotenera mobilis (strain JLW8 / ATCC BAA-1282 / DSM 17540) TaxID=583345 RepID=C6WT44_METML|nr:DNA polymerase III subunit chi [Methylotenera mobilis]ACT49106.1 DNA polymerase III chi subunit HolC [Methylotenera mobilis JLW8]